MPRQKGEKKGEGYVQVFLDNFGKDKLATLYKEKGSINAVRHYFLTYHKFTCSYNSIANYMKNKGIAINKRGGDFTTRKRR